MRPTDDAWRFGDDCSGAASRKPKATARGQRTYSRSNVPEDQSGKLPVMVPYSDDTTAVGKRSDAGCPAKRDLASTDGQHRTDPAMLHA